MTVEIMLYLVWMHFVADFLLQTDRIALNKSSSNSILLLHVTAYGLCFMSVGVAYALANTVLHFITDWITSRLTKRLWQANERHWFFVVIGLDQAAHMTALIATYNLFN